jgi:hypothetical protein
MLWDKRGSLEESPDCLRRKRKVQPLLAGLTRPAIAAVLGVSIKYAGDCGPGVEFRLPGIG